jgi:pilus assembly protein CpaF
MRAQIASAVDIVVQGTRYRDGTRKVTHISEVIGFDMETGRYQINDLFIRKVKGVEKNGRVISSLKPTGILPDCMETILAAGMDVPASVHEAKWRREQKGGVS